jgi:hypothetical protein
MEKVFRTTVWTWVRKRGSKLRMVRLWLLLLLLYHPKTNLPAEGPIIIESVQVKETA